MSCKAQILTFAKFCKLSELWHNLPGYNVMHLDAAWMLSPVTCRDNAPFHLPIAYRVRHRNAFHSLFTVLYMILIRTVMPHAASGCS